MRRRELMLLVGSALIAGRELRAQQKAMPVIGFLGSPTPGSYTALVAAFLHGLEEMGYIEGQNVAIEYRWAEGRFEQLPALSSRSRWPQGRRDRSRCSHFGKSGEGANIGV
jgi:hypothetical protein